MNKIPELICVLCVLFCMLWSVCDTRGVDLGMCPDDHLKCSCGAQSINRRAKVVVTIKRCSYFHRYSMYCKACTPYSKSEVCARFRLCATCDTNQDGACLSCPRGKYGNFCEHSCDCLNGGTCDTDGTCVCPQNYNGTKCEINNVCSCLNGGSCLHDSTCVCLPEYEGQFCERRKPANCDYPAVPVRGRVTAENLTEGAVATFFCRPPNVLVGPSAVTCLPLGRWSSPSPTCEYQCDVPTPGENQVLEVIPTQFYSSEGTTVVTIVRNLRLSCEAGFSLVGESSLQCLPSGVWNSDMPTCVRTCGEPLNIQYGHFRGNSFLEGASVVYECDEGYRIIGASTVLCLDGQWRANFPRCERWLQCPLPPEIAHGLVFGNDTSYSIGSSVQYQCDEGFRLEGGPEVRNCTEIGKWSGTEPWCERDTPFYGTTCPSPDVPDGGRIQNMQSVLAFTEGMRVTYECEEGYILVGDEDRVCDSDGNWTGSTPRCIQVITCDDPGIPKNTYREVTVPVLRNSRGSRLPDILKSSSITLDDDPVRFTLPEGKFRVYTKLKFRCESQFYQRVGSQQRRCLRDGTWSGRQPACVPICGKSATARLPLIYNGTVSDIGQWPWQAAISRLIQDDYWYITCGGSLITENLVVTAAHCVTRYQTDIKLPVEGINIYLGKHYRSHESDSTFVQKREVTAIEIHPNYDPSMFDLDVAVLWLNEPVTLTHYVRPVCLPSQYISERHLRPGTEGVVTGWGITEYSVNSEELRMAKVQTTTNADCMDKYAQVGYPQVFTENMFCAGYDDGSFDACEGDSGGPLVFPLDSDSDRTWYLEGIVSWGSPLGCGVELQYGVYTKVSHCMDWLTNFV